MVQVHATASQKVSKRWLERVVSLQWCGGESFFQGWGGHEARFLRPSPVNEMEISCHQTDPLEVVYHPHSQLESFISQLLPPWVCTSSPRTSCLAPAVLGSGVGGGQYVRTISCDWWHFSPPQTLKEVRKTTCASLYWTWASSRAISVHLAGPPFFINDNCAAQHFPSLTPISPSGERVCPSAHIVGNITRLKQLMF